jgi:hypothetical protein
MQGAEGTAAALAPVCYYVNSGFRAEYYDDPDLSGYLVTRIDQTIDSSTYTSFPPQGIDSDTFSVRWTGQIHAINSGTYTFYATADDGVRVTVDGVRIIDDWVYNPLPRSGSIDLGSGHYSIVVEYYEDTGAESMRLEWQMPGWPREIVNGSYFSFSSGGSGEGLYAEYYPLDLSGNPADMVSRIDREVDFKWGLSSPHPSISADRFFVRWTGQIEPTFSEIYSFYTVSSDGVRLSINGESVIDDWEDQPPTQNSNLVPLQAGQRYDIVIEYYENTGDAVVQFQWESQSQPRDVIQRSSLYPVNLSSGMVVPPSGSTQTFAIHALSRQRLYDIAWNMGVGQNTTQPFHFAVGKVFEDFVLGQFAVPHNEINVSSLRREQLSGSNIVRPDSITDVIEIDPETGDLTLYPASAIWEVKATSFSLIDLYFPYYADAPRRQAQITGEIEVASVSPLGQQNRDGSPPIFRLITTSDPQIGIDLIQESEQRSVAFFHGYVYEIQGTNPPLLFAGDLNLINNVSIANYITLHRRIGTPQTLTVYSLNITPPDPTDPDPEQLEDPS